MEQSTFFIVCSAIVLIASTVTSICTLVNFLKKPAQSYRERQDRELRDVISTTIRELLPTILEQHDLEVRDKYIRDVKKSVLLDIEDELDQVKILKVQYEALQISALDVLRGKIINIYTSNKDTKSLSTLDRERLDQFYKDYKTLNGNSYIDKYYKRMGRWTTIDDDTDDEDII